MVRYALLCCLLALAACSDPPTPDKEQPPEPQAVATAAKHDDLARAIERPQARAREAQAAIDAAAQVQSAALAAAEAGRDAADTVAP